MPENVISPTGILSTLTGNISSYVEPTRNGRLYPREEWERALNDPILVEQFKNHMVLGELGHPQDSEERLETLMERACINMPNPPVFDEDTGFIVGTVDILDTPMGRIAEAMRRAGCVFGISSRADGDVEEDPDTGIPTVHNLTLQGWDLVALPAVEDARLHLVESLGKDKTKEIKKNLQEAFDKSTYDEQQKMLKKLNEMDSALTEGINLKPNPDEEKEEDNKDTYKVEEGLFSEADNIGALIEQLDNTLAENTELKLKIKALQEQLSVGNAKEVKLNEQLSKYKDSTSVLSESAKEVKNLKAQITKLNEELVEKDEQLKQIQNVKAHLSERLQKHSTTQTQLNEDIKKKDLEIKSLNDKYQKLSEEMNSIRANHNQEVETLKHELADAKVDKKLLKEEVDKKKNQYEAYGEKCRGLVKEALNRYIDSKAESLGLNANEVRNKLPKKCSFDDIDNLCEELRQYKLNMSVLPFEISNKVKMKAKSPIQESFEGSYDDSDDVDEQLVGLASKF